MGAFEAGGGAGGGAVAAVSPLARMWRSVYAKAAEAAAVRMAALLRDHVYLFHRDLPTSGGGGGGGLIKIADRVVAAGGQTQALRLPASGTIAAVAPEATYLLLVGQARTRLTPPDTGTEYASNVWVSYNDDPIDGAGSLPSPFYAWEWHAHDVNNDLHAPDATTSDVGIQLGSAAGEDAPAGACTHYRADFPGFTGTAFRPGCVFQAVLHGADTSSRTAYEGGGYRRGTGAITSLTVFTNQANQFDVGTRWTLFGA
jgi:hypothetical protein